MTMTCLGECKPGLECTFDDVSAGHGTCTKTKKQSQIIETFDLKHSMDNNEILNLDH